ncbi:hypothetical protein GCM10008090_30530 [Arenicella chitinivorans]|uniref:Uncharacterized protein n=1 Tax=Arenicella chitinivorans TaxID=1329800 RepID=A0A918VSI2_9GAMM|nr:hypothetical protein [Arenicella chitinivorans]GHA18806.1 hypothetical protein GCM10008090_30530 [Arenicella chitinivorans]
MTRLLPYLFAIAALNACVPANTDTTAEQTEPAASATVDSALLDLPPVDGSCVGWQASLADGKKTDAIEQCLVEKARRDRAAAVKDASILVTWHITEGPYSELVPLVNGLSQFPEPGSMEAYLREIGVLTKPVSGEVDLERGLTASYFIEALADIVWFDAETGMFPNDHHYLMASVASGTDLKDVSFFETPPSDPNSDAAYQLRAEVNGNTYYQQAENYGDWYDIEAMLRLMNRVAVAENFKSRFVTLPTSDQTAIIWSASDDALQTLSQRGLIALGDATLSMVNGKAFEDEVKAALQKQAQ